MHKILQQVRRRTSFRQRRLLFDWSKEHALLVPPVSIALTALRKAMNTEMTGVLVVPHGRFWPALMPDGRHAAIGIKAIRHFYTKMVKSESSSKTTLLTDVFMSYLALYFEGGKGLKWEPQVSSEFCIATILGGHCKLCREQAR